ncbi:diguanylate cyclase [Vibrio sp. SCSIO 43136]|uniref:GGDEF domain-containing response regulator n=1 Tax=Vibrio sp. SCSIO 43136 TaxID=2819101 RepID=UPI002075982C|nr:diguanylate cyclase [Vibrio sp. SCSIO 43136]USD68238.1 diguanylate cyclase [Vibrio sp. SCSIO 43136]
MELSSASIRILLVDDLQVERMQLAIRLKQLGHSVEMAESGARALELYPSFEPELILLDISMPEMDGFEVAKHLRNKYEEWVPIIFLSSHEEPAMIARAIEAGGDDYLIKPVDKLVLNAKLVAMQRIASMRRELKLATAQLESMNSNLRKQVNEDGLTKVYNRRYINDEMQKMISWHGRHRLPMTVVLLDVDFFKAYNDTYGHIEGDSCLQRLADLLNKLFTRTGEFVGRYGGEEFAIIMSNSDGNYAEKQVNRIRMAISDLAIPHRESTVSSCVTVSQGAYSLIPTGRETTDDVFQVADQALYQAKHSGRDGYQVVTKDV